MADTSAGTSQDWQIKNGRWQWRDDSGNWNDYGDASNAKSRVVNVRDGQQTQYYNPMMGNWVYSPEKLTPTTQAQSSTQAPASQQSYLGGSPTISTGNPTGWSGGIGGGGGTNNMAGQQPEQVALQQIQQIDPTSSAVMNQLGSSYLDLLRNPAQVPTASQMAIPTYDKLQAGQLNMPSLENAPTKGAPSAGDLQSYLDLYKQVDPTGLAGRQQLEQQLTSQAALGSRLDPETAREITQQTRLGQTARGNVYGTPQLVQEAMTRGEAGLALQNQRQQALQGFYSSGQDVGNVANQLYQQGQTNYLNQLQGYLQNYQTAQNAWQANQNNALNYAANQRANDINQLNFWNANQQSQLNYWQAQQNQQAANRNQALGYLTSGATPYQMGSTYYNNAMNAAGSAAQGGPVYNPASLGQTYTGAGAGSFPDYGLNTSQNAQGWYNSLSAYNNQGYGRSGGGAGGAALGALGGAASGALAGAAGGIPGMIVGGIGGAIGGGLKGYSG